MTTIEERPRTISSIPQEYTKRLMVFGGRASMELAAKIAAHLNVDVGEVELRTFADGEVYCRYRESIRGADVFLVQSCYGRATNDHLWELLTMIQAAKLASANRITAPAPVYAPSPTLTGATSDVLTEIRAPSPIFVRCFARPS